MTYRADRLFLAGDAGRTRQGERTDRRRTLPAAAIHGRLHTGPYIPLPIFVSPVPHEEARRPQPENPATAPSFRRSQDDTPIRKAMHRNPQRKSSSGLPCGSHYRKGPLSESAGGDDERRSADKPGHPESGMRHFQAIRSRDVSGNGNSCPEIHLPAHAIEEAHGLLPTSWRKREATFHRQARSSRIRHAASLDYSLTGRFGKRELLSGDSFTGLAIEKANGLLPIGRRRRRTTFHRQARSSGIRHAASLDYSLTGRFGERELLSGDSFTGLAIEKANGLLPIGRRRRRTTFHRQARSSGIRHAASLDYSLTGRFGERELLSGDSFTGLAIEKANGLLPIGRRRRQRAFGTVPVPPNPPPICLKRPSCRPIRRGTIRPPVRQFPAVEPPNSDPRSSNARSPGLPLSAAPVPGGFPPAEQVLAVRLRRPPTGAGPFCPYPIGTRRFDKSVGNPPLVRSRHPPRIASSSDCIDTYRPIRSADGIRSSESRHIDRIRTGDDKTANGLRIPVRRTIPHTASRSPQTPAERGRFQDLTALGLSIAETVADRNIHVAIIGEPAADRIVVADAEPHVKVGIAD